MASLGKPLVAIGLAIALVGLLMIAGESLPLKIGRLPGDIVWRKGNTTLYFPLTTMILLNVVLAAVMWLFRR